MDKLLREMDLQETEASFAREFGIDTVHATRRARFRTVVTLILNGEKHFFEGVMEGRISRVKAGNGGFGYDPLFYSVELKKSFGLASFEEKNSVSHRARALNGLKELLKKEKI